MSNERRNVFGRPLDKALSGVRVLDFTTAWAGPRMTAYLAEMGAEVIHVESVQYLDTHRGWSKWAAGATGMFPENDPGRFPWERNSQFNEFNKNKLGITLDLTDPRGIAYFKELASISDVVVDNYKAGAINRFGLGYEDLKAIKPDIICLSGPAFGTTGPYKDYVAWGNQIAAIAAHALLMNYEDGDEPEPGNFYGDPVAAITGAFGVVAALIHLKRTGQGQYIEMPLAEVLPGLLPEVIADYVLNDRIAQPTGNRHKSVAPWGVYRCEGADDWVAICCATDADFVALAQVMNQPDLLTDPRFVTNTARFENRQALNEIISAWTVTQEKWSVADRLQALGIASEPTANTYDALSDPQLQARGFFTVLDHPEAGAYAHPVGAVRMSKTNVENYHAAPTYGQHNVEVLQHLLGVSAADFADLHTADIIGFEPLEDAERRARSRSGGSKPVS